MKRFIKPAYTKKSPKTQAKEVANTVATELITYETVLASDQGGDVTNNVPATPKHKTSHLNPSTPNSSASGGSRGPGFRLNINFGNNGTPPNIKIVSSHNGDSSVAPSSQVSGSSRKRSAPQVESDDEDYTDSEIGMTPSPQPKITHSDLKKAALAAKKTKGNDQQAIVTMPVKVAKKNKNRKDSKTKKKDADGDSVMSGTEELTSLILMQPSMKRKNRIVDPEKDADAALIAAAVKDGSEIYNSDAEDLTGNPKHTKQTHLFRNVQWGPAATDMTGDFPTKPEFSQFVPGRWERMPDGSIADQKHKLIVKLTDKHGQKRIFTNPPPRNWNNQEAITILNKRTVQQIRRNTDVRFREVVEPYIEAERSWILANLSNGKPMHGWEKFVNAFNRQFAGRTLDDVPGRRPERSQSSLTKEVERFGEKFYKKGLVPVPAEKEGGKQL